MNVEKTIDVPGSYIGLGPAESQSTGFFLIWRRFISRSLYCTIRLMALIRPVYVGCVVNLLLFSPAIYAYSTLKFQRRATRIAKTETSSKGSVECLTHTVERTRHYYRNKQNNRQHMSHSRSVRPFCYIFIVSSYWLVFNRQKSKWNCIFQFHFHFCLKSSIVFLAITLNFLPMSISSRPRFKLIAS